MLIYFIDIWVMLKCLARQTAQPGRIRRNIQPNWEKYPHLSLEITPSGVSLAWLGLIGGNTQPHLVDILCAKC